MPATISINRAPVLTLWAAVVAQRLGFRWDESLSLGKALAGLNAQSKGRRLGLFKPHEEKTKSARERARGEQFWIELCGRPVPAKNMADGIRAVSGRDVVTAESAEAYLETKFGDHLEAARAAMTTLAHAYRPRELAAEAFALYEEFRPAIPEGVKGWGARGVLDLRRIRSLALGWNLRRRPRPPARVIFRPGKDGQSHGTLESEGRAGIVARRGRGLARRLAQGEGEGTA